MKINFATILFCSIFIATHVKSQVLVNEINPEYSGPVFEIKNYGSSVVDISAYTFLADGFLFNISSSLTLCPFVLDTTIDPGEHMAFRFGDLVGVESGEIVMYVNSDTADVNNMLQYIAWGQAGFGLEQKAVAAGLWELGQFAPSITEEGSLEYFENQNSNWESWQRAFVHSMCEENGTGCNVNLPSSYSTTGETEFCMGDGEFNSIGMQFSQAGSPLQLIVYNTDSILAATPQEVSELINYDTLIPGTYFVTLISHEGELLNVEVGNHLDQIEGCFTILEPIEIDGNACDVSTEQALNQLEITIFNNIEIQIDTRNIGFQDLSCKLFDINGRLFLQKNFASEETNITIDISHLPPGTFTFFIESDKGIVTKKFIRS